jgi:general L-amino acid transport system ATP-binding protein
MQDMADTGMTNTAKQTGGEKSEWAVEIIAMNKWYGDFHVLRDINLTVARGERIVICGPSGGGKSTMLRCINRLEDWQRGRVIVDGK